MEAVARVSNSISIFGILFSGTSNLIKSVGIVINLSVDFDVGFSIGDSMTIHYLQRVRCKSLACLGVFLELFLFVLCLAE